MRSMDQTRPVCETLAGSFGLLRIMTVNGLHPDDNEGVRPLAEQRGSRVAEESEDRKNLMEQPQGKTDSQNANNAKEPNHLRAQ
jgi:hypothetical protein